MNGAVATPGLDQARGAGRSRTGTSRKPSKGHALPGGESGELRKVGVRQKHGRDSIRLHLMRTAFEAAQRRGYQALRISDITDPADVTRQAFYAHFRDKRHCLCEALDPRLAAIERLASPTGDEAGSRLSAIAGSGPDDLELSTEWPNEIIAAIDELLIEQFGSAEGTKGRLVEALAQELEQAASLPGVRIGNLVKRAHVPQGDFYRHFSGKRECFAVLYSGRLDALLRATRAEAARPSIEGEPGTEEILRAFGNELEADVERARILILGEGELPSPEDKQSAGSRRGALGRAVAGLVRDGDEHLSEDFLVGALTEVIRRALLTDDLEGLGSKLLATHRSIAGAEIETEHPAAA